MKEDKEIIKRNLITLSEKCQSDNLFKGSFKNFIPENKKELKNFIWVIVISFVPSILTAFNKDTVLILLSTTEIILNIIIALFGIIFTGYALLQSLMGDGVFKRLISSTISKKKTSISIFQETIEKFSFLMFQYIGAIMINIILILILNAISSEYTICANILVSNIVASIFISIYYAIMINVIFKVKNFVKNTVRLFNIFGLEKGIELLNDTNDDD
ncbi:MAG: hypothetical protein ACLRZ7_00845 [Lachnospiraceae bacterium]